MIFPYKFQTVILTIMVGWSMRQFCDWVDAGSPENPETAVVNTLDLDFKSHPFPIHKLSLLENFPSLTYLGLVHNEMLEFPTEIGKLTHLKRLVIGGKKVVSLPSVIGNLTNLIMLCIKGANFTHLPAEIEKLTNLRTLQIKGAKFTHLPVEIGKLTNLRTLHIEGAKFTHLPAEIGNLSKLTDLTIYGTRLDQLPFSAIVKLNTLEVIDFRSVYFNVGEWFPIEFMQFCKHVDFSFSVYK
jgi:Leucine-rich repeat (LRR) protein